MKHYRVEVKVSYGDTVNGEWQEKGNAYTRTKEFNNMDCTKGELKRLGFDIARNIKAGDFWDTSNYRNIPNPPKAKANHPKSKKADAKQKKLRLECDSDGKINIYAFKSASTEKNIEINVSYN